eukprot:353916-Chlamydomonas_euryale.AAC.8
MSVESECGGLGEMSVESGCGGPWRDECGEWVQEGLGGMSVESECGGPACRACAVFACTAALWRHAGHSLSLWWHAGAPVGAAKGAACKSTPRAKLWVAIYSL